MKLRDILFLNRYIFIAALIFNDSKAKKFVNRLESHQKQRDDIRTLGFSMIEGFFTAEECDTMSQFIEDYIGVHDRKFANDHRIYSIQKLNSYIKEKFHDSEILRQIGEDYTQTHLILQSTLGAKLVEEAGNKGSGGGWHRDSHTLQYKNIAYLSDVTEENGPFEYVAQSHTKQAIFDALKYRPPGKNCHNYRFTQQEIDEISSKMGLEVVTVCAPKGSLLLADTRGLHRGKPLIKGVRYALTNYFVPEDLFQPEEIFDEVYSHSKNQ